MPFSKKQLAANRHNAQKSTGPKTPEGKAVSSRNALKHGIRSAELVIASPRFKENPEHYRRIYDSFMEEFKPTSHIQKCLATEIVNAIWRSRRVARVESALLQKYPLSSQSASPLLPDSPDDSLSPERLALFRACLVALNSNPCDTSVYSALRYGREIDGRLTRLYRTLRHIQMLENLERRQKPGAKN